MTITHVSGNCIRFLNTEDNEERFLESPGDGIGAFAVNTVYNTIALSEVCIDARIFVYDVSDFSKTRSVLKGMLSNYLAIFITLTLQESVQGLCFV